MNRRLILITALLAGISACTFPAQAQQTPHIGYVFPAGGRQGTEFEVRVGGQFLNGVDKAHVSGSGIQIKVVELVKPMTQMQANQLREKLQALVARLPGGAGGFGKQAGKQGGKAAAKPGDKAGSAPGDKPAGTAYSRSSPQNTAPLTAEERQSILDIRKKLLKFFNQPPTPAVAETAVLHVTVEPDAEPGIRELRLQTPAGLTNPLVFQIGGLPEVVRKPVDDNVLPGQQPLRKLAQEGRLAVGAQPMIDVQLPAVVNGQILSGQVDRYRFAAKKGQQLVFAVSARQLVPYIADAVPGWFQAAIRLCDADGKELAYAGNYRFHPDPVLHYEVPRDGQYVVEINDSCFRGREDFIYRMQMGELPFITSVFPLGGKAGEATRITMQGWNLAEDHLTIDAGAGRLSGSTFGAGLPTPPLFGTKTGHRQETGPNGRHGQETGPNGSQLGPPNSLPFAQDSLPECMEQEPNDSPEHAQAVTLPIIVNGRIDRPGDRDVFRFEGKAGQEIVAEVYARRLDSPVDSVLKLTGPGVPGAPAGRQLAFNDDHEDKAYGLITHHADSWLRAVLPSAGTYYLHLYDAQNQGGPEYAYRLRISPPRPDFDLRVVPSSVNARAGTSVPITVHAVRRDGFNGPIELQLVDAPPGFRLSGATVPAGQAKVRLTLSVPFQPGQAPTALRMEGRATIAGEKVRRPVVPADDMMQAYYFRHLVPAQQWLVDVIGLGRGAIPFRLRDVKEVKLPAGGTVELHFVGPHGPMVQTLKWNLSEPPDGLSIQKVSTTEDGITIVLRADATKLKSGWKGNAIIEAAIERVPQNPNAKGQLVKRIVSLGALPAAPVEVVGK